MKKLILLLILIPIIGFSEDHLLERYQIIIERAPFYTVTKDEVNVINPIGIVIPPSTYRLCFVYKDEDNYIVAGFTNESTEPGAIKSLFVYEYELFEGMTLVDIDVDLGKAFLLKGEELISIDVQKSTIEPELEYTMPMNYPVMPTTSQNNMFNTI